MKQNYAFTATGVMHQLQMRRNLWAYKRVAGHQEVYARGFGTCGDPVPHPAELR